MKARIVLSGFVAPGDHAAWVAKLAGLRGQLERMLAVLPGRWEQSSQDCQVTDRDWAIGLSATSEWAGPGNG